MEDSKVKLNYRNIALILAVVAFAILAFNQLQIRDITSAAVVGGDATTQTSSYDAVKTALKGIIPTGVPAIYGEELGVSYDDISASNPQKADATIGILGNLDRAIQLSGDTLQRYIAVGSQISCEYCCGAKAIIFPTGEPACGCAHSYAMRGLAKYLLTEHPDVSNEAILEELGKWKVLFFPDIHIQKASVLQQEGIELNYINLASNEYRGIEQEATGGMVGGC